ncbi:MAG: protein-disulfide reductase DsbD domain-containing protein [Balneolaceae bacterium]
MAFRSRILPAILSGLLLSFIIAFQAYAQLLDPVTYRISRIPPETEAGAVIEVEVEADIEGKWHLYSIQNPPEAGPIPTRFSSSSDQMGVAGEVRESQAEIEYDPNFDIELGWHSTRALFTVPVAFRPGTRGEQTVGLEVLYQACDDVSCLPPRRKSIEASITVSGDADSGFLYRDFPDGSQPDPSKGMDYGIEFVVGIAGFILISGIVIFIFRLRMKDRPEMEKKS